MFEKRVKPLFIYMGFFFSLIGMLSIFLVGGVTEFVILPLCLIIGCLFLSIGLKNSKQRGFIIMIVITCTLFMVIIGGTYVVIKGNPLKKAQSKQAVDHYLIQEKHYTAKDLLQIKGYYRMYVNRTTNTCHYGAKVIFQQKPNTATYYVVCPKNQVIALDQKTN